MLSAFVLLFVAAATASAMQTPLDSSSMTAAVAQLAQTAQAGTDIGRQLQQAASNSGDISASLGPMLQGLAGTSAASNAASNTGSSAASAVSSAVASLGQTLGSQVTSVSDIQLQLEQLLLQFCSTEEFTPPTQVPATWVGSGATIALVPHTCLIFPENNTLACSPAQLVLYQNPGSYNKAYTSAASWTGKECKIQEQLGKGSMQLIGGANYTVDIPQPVQLKSLWTPIYANEQAAAPVPAAGASAAASSSSGSNDPLMPKPSTPTKPSKPSTPTKPSKPSKPSSPGRPSRTR